MSFCRRRLTFALHPGRHIPREHHAWGKTMPSGVIRGAAPYFSNQELEQLVVITRRISGQTLTTWDFPILSFLSWAMSFLITRGAGAFSFFTRGAGACVQTLCHSVEADGIARFRDFASAGGRRGFTMQGLINQESSHDSITPVWLSQSVHQPHTSPRHQGVEGGWQDLYGGGRLLRVA